MHVLFSSCGLNRGVADGLVWIISWTVLSWHAPFHLPSRGCASALRLLLWYCVARNRRCVALVVSLVTSLTIALVSFVCPVICVFHLLWFYDDDDDFGNDDDYDGSLVPNFRVSFSCFLCGIVLCA